MSTISALAEKCSKYVVTLPMNGALIMVPLSILLALFCKGSVNSNLIGGKS
jgi:hypothetical protein